MRAIAVSPAIKEVSIINQPEPEIASPFDVKLRMLEAGVCGTDKEICAFEYGTPPAGSGQLVIGHESLGEAVEVGPEVTRVELGDLVVPMVRRPCRHETCVACRSDRQDFCFTGDFRERGIKEAHGFMAQFVVDHEKYMNPVPKELRNVAVLVEPLTIAESSDPGLAGSAAPPVELPGNTGEGSGQLPPSGGARRRPCRAVARHGVSQLRFRHLRLLPRTFS